MIREKTAVYGSEEILEIASYEEMERRPRFVKNLDAKSAKLLKPLGLYVFPPEAWVSCGLSSCHHKHGKGMLVLTEDGRETNIGKDCGRTHFGSDFSALWSHAERIRTRARNLAAVLDFRSTIPTYRAELEALLAEGKGGKWAQRMVSSFARNCPDPVRRSVLQMSRSDSAEIFQEIPLSPQEVEDARALGTLASLVKTGGQYLRRDHVGALSGLAVFKDDLKKLLIDDVEAKLNVLETEDVLTLGDTSLRRHVEWITDLPVKIDKGRRLIEDARRFFSEENLEKLKLLSPSHVRGLAAYIEAAKKR